MDLVILTDQSFDDEPELLEGSKSSRSVEMTNEEWMVITKCVEAYSETYRGQHSQIVATYVTRNQLEEAVNSAQRMNSLLQQLDKIQAKLMS